MFKKKQCKQKTKNLYFRLAQVLFKSSGATGSEKFPVFRWIQYVPGSHSSNYIHKVADLQGGSKGMVYMYFISRNF